MALILSGDTGVPASGMPTGSVLQVVQGTLSAVVTTTSSTYSNTGLTATITPLFSSSKILVLVNHQGVRKYGANTSVGQRILRNGSVIRNMDSIAGFTNTSGDSGIGTTFQQHLDSPATTSATTYSTQYNSQANSGTACINDYYSDGTSSTITLLEIKQ